MPISSCSRLLALWAVWTNYGNLYAFVFIANPVLMGKDLPNCQNYEKIGAVYKMEGMQ